MISFFCVTFLFVSPLSRTVQVRFCTTGLRTRTATAMLGSQGFPSPVLNSRPVCHLDRRVGAFGAYSSIVDLDSFIY